MKKYGARSKGKTLDIKRFLVYSKTIMLKSKTKLMLIVVLPLLILIFIIATIAHRFFPGEEDEYQPRYPVTQSAEMQHDKKLSHVRPDKKATQKQKPYLRAISHHLKTRPILINFSLNGTANVGTKDAMAVIENKIKNNQKLYKIGDTIENGIIKSILKRKVVVLINGNNEILHMTRGVSSMVESEKIKQISRLEVEQAFKNKKGLLARLSIEPHTTGNGKKGLLVDRVEPDSIFDQIGFQKGDLIREINGAEINRPEMLTAIYNGMKIYPFKNLSFDLLGPSIDKVILGINPQAGGIIKEAIKVYQKGQSGENIPLKLIRNGMDENIVFKIK